MLREIPTAHPAIMFGYLAALSGLVYYNLHDGLQKPDPEMSFVITVVVAVVGGFFLEASRKRRAKALREKYSERRVTRSRLDV